ncbi:unnamed protein product [Protopolystoma xenopodis]|uniref:Uncharacterized protein n=1 Tax=Protopolystoma xenopodis TaxID=117903 RepID=A0A448WJF1_9PLAT|nr:unnamed protein product [Protopolystoma xenopodis]
MGELVRTGGWSTGDWTLAEAEDTGTRSAWAGWKAVMKKSSSPTTSPSWEGEPGRLHWDWLMKLSTRRWHHACLQTTHSVLGYKAGRPKCCPIPTPALPRSRGPGTSAFTDSRTEYIRPRRVWQLEPSRRAKPKGNSARHRRCCSSGYIHLTTLFASASHYPCSRLQPGSTATLQPGRYWGGVAAGQTSF